MATAVNGILLVGPLVKYYGACPRRWLAVFFALCQYLFYLLHLPFTFTSTFTFYLYQYLLPLPILPMNFLGADWLTK